jgi:hypothetical protein
MEKAGGVNRIFGKKMPLFAGIVAAAWSGRDIRRCKI